MSIPYDPDGSRSTFRSRLWTFANSSFGLWLFSGLLVGLATFSWSEWKDQKNQQRDHERQVSRLRTEIRARVERCYRLIQRDWTAPTGVPLDRRLRQAGVAGPPDTVVVFPEFKDRPLSSLFWEIRMLEPDINDTFAVAQGVSEEVETGVWARSEPGTSGLPSDDAYSYHVAMLNILRSDHARSYDQAMRKLVAEHPPPTKEEEEGYLRTNWPEYAKLKKEIDRQNAVERARKLKILQETKESTVKTKTDGPAS
jgi:hypothetical protein